jgi:FkbM family methyltransferase
MEDASTEDLFRTLEDHYFGPNMQERKEIAALPGLLRDARVFVDVGAGLGQYSYFANRAMHESTIYAIEADPLRFERLRELCGQWARDSAGNKIFPLKVALSDKTGTAKFFVTDADHSGGLFPYSGIREGSGSHSWREVEVKCETLDSLFLQEGGPDLVKIDVEGGEYRVLLGSAGILRRGKTRFLVEVHPWGDPTIGKTEADVFDLFARFGYDFKRVHHHWLFAKSQSRLWMRLKNRLIHVILDHPRVRATVRKLFRAPR